jgi:type I restriction enzyme, S subunit
MIFEPLILGESLELLIDNRGKNPPYAASGVPVVSGMSIRADGIDLRASKFATADTWKSWMPKPTQPGDVIMTSEAPLGRVAMVRTSDPILLAQRVFGLRGRPGVLDSKFLYYALQSSAVQSDLASRATGSTVLGIRQPALRSVLIPAPEYEQQKAIADVLGALDDKIAANREVVVKSDETAGAIWKSFMSSGRLVKLSELASFVNGKAFTKDASGKGRVVVRIAELNSGIGSSTVYNDIDVANEHVARPGDLLFAWSGSLTAARWYRPDAIVNQHIFKVIPRNGIPLWAVNQAVRSKLEEFRAIASDKATTMGHIQRRHLDEPVLVPDEGDLSRLNHLMSSLWESALAAEIENETLIRTRDQLLPLLMSGEVRVRDAEVAAADAR